MTQENRTGRRCGRSIANESSAVPRHWEGGQLRDRVLRRASLAVVPQQVVPIQAESADGGDGSETGVRSVPIVAVEPGCEVLGALGGGVVGVGIGPFSQRGLDEAFGLTVGSGREGPGVAMSQT